MPVRIRRCAECPKCHTRYLLGFSPYRNGSYLLPVAVGAIDEYVLHCACGKPPVCTRVNCAHFRAYVVSKLAHHRGYGAPEEIVLISEPQSDPASLLTGLSHPTRMRREKEQP
jgi:hypothetical protein